MRGKVQQQIRAVERNKDEIDYPKRALKLAVRRLVGQYCGLSNAGGETAKHYERCDYLHAGGIICLLERKAGVGQFLHVLLTVTAAQGFFDFTPKLLYPRIALELSAATQVNSFSAQGTPLPGLY